VRLDLSSISTIKSAQEYYKFVFNVLCVTLFVTSPVAVFEAAMLVKSMYMTKLWSKTRKTREKHWNQRNLYPNLHQKRFFIRNGFHRRADARKSVDIIYGMWRIYRYFCGSGI